jgi:hypothetical protein
LALALVAAVAGAPAALAFFPLPGDLGGEVSAVVVTVSSAGFCAS